MFGITRGLLLANYYLMLPRIPTMLCQAATSGKERYPLR